MAPHPDLIEFRSSRYSQFGEDGILRRIFEAIGTDERWCVEFGAWDGKHLSNTAALIESGWRGVLIERDERRTRTLQANWAERPDVITLHREIGLERGRLDDVLASTPIPSGFDLLSIDIDGDDHHVWRSLERYRPRVVVVEANLSFPWYVEFVQRPGAPKRIGSSALSLYRLGLAKGYRFVCFNVINCFFVREDLADAVPQEPRSFAYLFEAGLDHHLFASTSQEGRLFVLGDRPYGSRRNPFARLANMVIRDEAALRSLAETFRVVRGEERLALLREPVAATERRPAI